MKQLKFFVVTILVSCIWIACLLDNKTSNKGPTADSIPFKISDTSEILEKSASQIITKNVDKYCDNGQLMTDVSIDTTNYEIVNGQLRIWSPGDCQKVLFNGSSPGVNGFWASALDTISAMDPTCTTDGDLAEMKESLLSPNMSVDITDTRVVSQIEGGMCFAKMALQGIEDDTANGGGDVNIKNVRTQGCNTMAYDMAFGNVTLPVTASFLSFTDDVINMNMSIGSCSQTIPMPNFMQDPTDCKAEQTSDSLMSETMGLCMFTYLYDQNQIAEFMVSIMEFDSVRIISGRSFEAYDPDFDNWTQYSFVKENNEIFMVMTVGTCSLKTPVDPEKQDQIDSTAMNDFITCLFGGQKVSLKRLAKKIPNFNIPIPKFRRP